MKRMLYAIVAGMLLLAPMSCKKDDPAPAAPVLPAAPEALAEHNTKSGGVYKGTFANSTSSGTIKTVLQGGVTNITIVYNGVSRTLTTTDLASWTSGEQIVAAVFTSGDWSATFSASSDGSAFDIALDLAGESSFNTVIVKETSTLQVKVYEGTYAGDATGKWNFTVVSALIYGVYAGDGSSDTFTGAVVGNNITIVSSGDVTATGTFAAEMSTCSGTWASSSSAGTWSGSRKI